MPGWNRVKWYHLNHAHRFINKKDLRSWFMHAIWSYEISCINALLVAWEHLGNISVLLFSYPSMWVFHKLCLWLWNMVLSCCSRWLSKSFGLKKIDKSICIFLNAPWLHHFKKKMQSWTLKNYFKFKLLFFLCNLCIQIKHCWFDSDLWSTFI